MTLYATITIELHKAGMHVRCDDADLEVFIRIEDGLQPLVDMINGAEMLCSPDTVYSITEKGLQYLEDLKRKGL